MVDGPAARHHLASRRHPEPAASLLNDDAFEPNSSFVFEDQNDDEEFRNMQRNIASLNVLAAGNQAMSSSVNGSVHTNSSSGIDDQYNPEFVGSFVLSHDDMSLHSPPWHNDILAMEQQAAMTGGRSSVCQQFGQMTPPNDPTPKCLPKFSVAARAGAAAAPTVHRNTMSAATGPIAQIPSTTQPAVSTKSERARNAANQRHAKARARKDSAHNHFGCKGDEDAEVEDKRERYREKNRLAAAKCRAKKKVNTEDLEESAREATTLNNRLRAEARELRDMFSSLRDQALAHDPSQGCECQSIHAYNLHKAQETARGVTGLPGLGLPSPSQGSLGSTSPTTVAASSRAQSFSGMRPQSQQYSVQAQSFVGGIGYVPTVSGEMLSHVSQPTLARGDGFLDFMNRPESRQLN